VTNRICLGCGLVYQSPRMTETEAAAFYAEEYRLLQECSADPTARNTAVQNARAWTLYGFVHPLLSSVSRHLDIGCSMGILLQHFQSAYHDQVVGIEPGEVHLAKARQQGLVVYPTLEQLERAGEAHFDLVTMSHVLEHLPDPVGYLTHLRDSILAQDGRLLLEVPNLYSHDSFEVAHLYAFSPHSLREIVRRSGFAIVKAEQHGRPNSALLPLYLTVLCHPFPQPNAATSLNPALAPVRPEKFVGFKRLWGMFMRRILSRLFPKRAWLMQG
jgi:SAM-dependent methyltransferase